jgi:dUTP pyrophosphatase
MRSHINLPYTVSEIGVSIQRLPHAPRTLPSYQTEGAVGMDLCLAGQDVVLPPHARALLPTGFRIAIPAGFEGQVRARSSFALRTGVILPNSPGTIDPDYRGELKVLVMNATDQPVRIDSGERVAQLVISPVARCKWIEVEDLPSSSRGENGFGSTGRT